MTDKVLNFSLTREEMPVRIGDGDYVLQELDGAERDRYLQDVGGRIRIAKDGNAAGVKNFKGMQAFLVSLALKKQVSGDLENVPVDTIQGWPSKVVSGLFDAARELSGLDKEDGEDEVGND